MHVLARCVTSLIRLRESISVDSINFLEERQTREKNSQIDRHKNYFMFVIQYLKRTHYIGTIISMFLFSFLLESCNRYIQIQLFKMENSMMNDYSHIIHLFIISISLTIYKRFKKYVESMNELKLETIFEKDVFLLKAKIPFYLRQKIDMQMLDELKTDVLQDLKVMIDIYLTSFIDIFIHIVIASYVFYENKMFLFLGVISISCFLFIQKVTYPLTKNGIKKRENKMKEIREKRNEISLLEFYFQPFVENISYFEQICDKNIEISKIDYQINNIYDEPIRLFDFFVDITIFIVLTTNFMKGFGNYYILISTLKSLFDTSSLIMGNIIQMEVCVDHYIDFMDHFKDSAENDYNCVKKISFPINIDLHIEMYDGYVLNGKLEINKNDRIFLTGHSGSGKSSLAKKIAGYDYYSKDENIYRKCVYYITQDFQVTWSNGNYLWKHLFPNMEMKEIKKHLNYFMFPMHKIDDSDDVSSCIPILSGGELKRLQYAYLFHRDIKEEHEIIICDELNMSLDRETTDKLIMSLEKLYQNKILIVIQHEKPTSKDFSFWKEWNVRSDGFVSIFS